MFSLGGEFDSEIVDKAGGKVCRWFVLVIEVGEGRDSVVVFA